MSVSRPLSRLLVALAAALLLAAACAEGNGERQPTPVPSPSPEPTRDPACLATPPASAEGSAFQNGSFEEGSAPWFSLATEAWGRPFEVSQAQAQSGANSAYLQLRSEDGGGTRVYGVVQEITRQPFPETISGYYYVDRWEKGNPKLYLQFVVIVDGASNIPREVLGLGANNHQVRYLLAGVDQQPTDIANSRYVFVGTEAPAIGEWVRFERDLRQDFCDLWGSIPIGYNFVRVLFEVRWDDRMETDAPSAADVYYDDLYLGPPGGVP